MTLHQMIDEMAHDAIEEIGVMAVKHYNDLCIKINNWNYQAQLARREFFD